MNLQQIFDNGVRGIRAQGRLAIKARAFAEKHGLNTGVLDG